VGFAVHDSLGLLETRGLTPALAALDVMEKSASIRVVQAELNDLLGVVIKIAGDSDSVAAAIAAGRETARQMTPDVAADVIRRVDGQAWRAIDSPAEFNPLIQQNVVHQPAETGESAMTEPPFALGLIETQGFTAVFEAIDTACKAANVEVVGKEKLGGGYVTVVIKGDVAAVKAAVESGRQKVDGLGKLIAAHVIARPSPAVLSLLPQVT
jgi:microcompartment protein CcmL/EutN